MKKGFWCIVQFHKWHWYMLSESYDSYSGEGDYGYLDYWTGNRKYFSDLKWYEHYGWGYDDFGFCFVVPFFIAYLLVLRGTIIAGISNYLFIKRSNKVMKEFLEQYKENKK